MLSSIRDFLTEHITCAGSPAIITGILLAAIIVVSISAYYILKKILALFERIILRTPSQWDDDLINSKLLQAISQLAPAILVNWMLPGFFGGDPKAFRWLSALTSLYIVGAVVWIVWIFLGNLLNAFQRRENMKAYAVKGVFQMVKLIILLLGIIVSISIIIGRSPMVIIGALGASAAVLMLVFQDTILGLVASVQLTANKMLHKGDWIVADKFNTNGEVLDVSLTTIKVRNWDYSISTIPPYSLVSGSFKNYENMRLSGGRRVERPIYIDANTVRFCTPDELADLQAEGWLEGLSIDEAKRYVNLHLLRLYLENYLLNHPDVRHDNPSMQCMVRQLEPTPSGLPLELYFFTRITSWVDFEHLQADIFDHVYAIVRRFGLAIFQTPAGRDIAK